MSVRPYHPALAALHWLLALAITAALGLGLLVHNLSNGSPDKLDLLRWHMAGGMGILACMLVRGTLRWMTYTPPPGPRLRDRLARRGHALFYVLILAMAATGITTAVMAGLNRSVFQHTGEALPENLGAYASFRLHQAAALTLVLLIICHVVGALYHHWALKDGLLRRMGFDARLIQSCNGSEAG
jgi:cytochrome b561